jgi:uncharacterized ferritin-like protein (DUF455 family)
MTAPHAAKELRQHALVALLEQNPERKVALTQSLWAEAATLLIATDSRIVEPAGVPGTPARPELRSHLDVPKRSPFTHEGLAALLHSVTHIEFNAINLALDAIWRFEGMPHAYYLDWLKVAAEEALHFTLLRTHLQSMGYDYSDFPAHTGLWDMTGKTSDDVLARMALVPRTLEARGLDATPPMQAKLRRVGTPARRAIRCTARQGSAEPGSTPACRVHNKRTFRSGRGLILPTVLLQVGHPSDRHFSKFGLSSGKNMPT